MSDSLINTAAVNVLGHGAYGYVEGQSDDGTIGKFGADPKDSTKGVSRGLAVGGVLLVAAVTGYAGSHKAMVAELGKVGVGAWMRDFGKQKGLDSKKK